MKVSCGDQVEFEWKFLYKSKVEIIEAEDLIIPTLPKLLRLFYGKLRLNPDFEEILPIASLESEDDLGLHPNVVVPSSDFE